MSGRQDPRPLRAAWHSAGRMDAATGELPVAFDVEGGQVLRLSLSARDVAALVDIWLHWLARAGLSLSDLREPAPEAEDARREVLGVAERFLHRAQPGYRGAVMTSQSASSSGSSQSAGSMPVEGHGV